MQQVALVSLLTEVKGYMCVVLIEEALIHLLGRLLEVLYICIL